MADNAQEKTESPTERRRQESRKDGQIAFSRELTSVALLGIILLISFFYASGILSNISEILTYTFNHLILPDFDKEFLYQLFLKYVLKSSWIVLPLFAGAFTMAILASAMQVGINFTAKPIQPKFEKISPIRGFGRLFSRNTVSEFTKIVLKIILILYLGYLCYADSLEIFALLSSSTAREILNETMSLIGLFAFRIFLAFLIIAVFDYLYQRWDMEQRLKMSKQDIKEELKQAEGDPQLKARIREIQKQMSQARMMQEVPKADFVVNNPIHYAIAMQYERETHGAPKVIAKGADFLAIRIMEIAKDNDIPIIRNPSVAKAIYEQVEIGEEIPEEFYKAIAEILAFVYKSKKKSY